MSNLQDWFQDVYDKNKKMIFKLLKLACDEDTTIRLTVSPDGTVTFCASNDDILKTIVQTPTSIEYRQYHEFSKKEEDE